MNAKAPEPQQRPYYIPKEKRENPVLRSVAELVKQLGNAAPKIDHTCKVVKRDDN